MATAGSLVVNLLARTQSFTNGLNSAKSLVSSFVSSITAKLASLASVATVTAGLMSGIAAAAQTEMATTSLSTMMGDAKKAQQLMKEIKVFAAQSPFDTAGLRGGAQTLLAYGVAGDKIMPTLRMLGDVAQGDANKLRLITLAYAQIQSTGRLMGQDLLQLVNAGFNPLQEISRKTGKSMVQLKSEMEDGAISAQMVTDAFLSATSSGGRFYQATANGSKTLVGQWAQLKDAIALTLEDIGQEIINGIDLKGIIQQGQQLVSVLGRELVFAIRLALSVLHPLITGLRSMPLAGIAIVASIAGMVVAIGALVRSMLLLSALAGPKVFLGMLAGLAAAATASGLVDAQIKSMTREIKAASTAPSASTLQADPKTTKTTPYEALEKKLPEIIARVKQLQDVMSHSPALGKAILGKEGAAFDDYLKKAEHANVAKSATDKLQRSLLDLQKVRVSIGEEAFARGSKIIMDQIGAVTGVTDAIQKMKAEMSTIAYGAASGQADAFYKAGASKEQVHEFLATAHELEGVKVDQKIKAINDEIAIMNGLATEGQIALKNMLADGVPSSKAEEMAAKIDEKNAVQKQKQRHEEMTREAESLRKTIESPFEKYTAMIDKLSDLERAGLLTAEERAKLYEKAKQDLTDEEAKLAGNDASRNKNVGAARFGTEQVASSIFSAKYSDPTKKLEEYARKQVTATEDVKKAIEDLKQDGGITLATLEG